MSRGEEASSTGGKQISLVESSTKYPKAGLCYVEVASIFLKEEKKEAELHGVEERNRYVLHVLLNDLGHGLS